jgi:uncharacterized MAPEG superfamily protein
MILLAILLVLVLLLVQAQMIGALLSKQVGAQQQTGPRDNLPEPTVELGRARRALANLQETLPIFLTLATLSIVLGEQGWISAIGAWLYLLARIGHVICYMRGLSPWRSICFLLSVIGNLILAIPLVPHIWN